MKKTKIIFSVMIAVLMLAASTAFMSSAAFAETESFYAYEEIALSDAYTSADSAEGFSFFSRAEFDGCYGNQLEGTAKELYDSLADNYVTKGKTGEYTYTFKAPFTFRAAVSGGSIVMNDELEEIVLELQLSSQAAMDAFLYDHPEVYWLKIAGISYSISASANPSGGYTGIIRSVNMTPTEIYSGASAKKSQYNTAVNFALGEITVTESRRDTLKSVHDYICRNAWYNLVSEQRVHSSEAFFLGDGGVVCEGYAKTFKVICDRLDIPCVLVSGDAGGPHMWNYVQMEDGKWYLVDVTWDDQGSKIYDTYFLANSNTVGFDGVAISRERTERTDFSGTGIFSFTYPELSATAYTAHTHEWENRYTVDVEPTCTKTGSKSIHCKTCSAKKSITTVSATNHPDRYDRDGQASTCTETGYTAGVYCPDCKKWLSGHSQTPVVPHEYKETIIPATFTADGEIIYKCSCGKVSEILTIAKIGSVTLSNENYIYDGKNKTPKVTVKDADGKTLVKNTDYKLSVASKRSGIGRYTVKVTFIGNYSGTKSVYFYIKTGKPATVKSASQTTSSVKLSWSAVPGASGYTVYRYSSSKKTYVKAGTTEGTSFTVKSLYAGTKYTFRVVSYGKTTAGKVYDSDSYALLKTATKTKTPELTKVTASSTKGQAVITHTNVSGETGYTVYYSTKKDSGFKKYANFKADTTTCNITGLTSGKTYYFKVRTYITTDSGYVYSAWSAVKSVKTK